MFSKLISNILPHMPKKFVWMFSKGYIGGETVEQAINTVKSLNQKGFTTTLDVLGEFIKHLDEAEANKQENLDVIEATQAAGIDCTYSIKPTSFGLLIDQEVCYQHMREIVAKAASYNNFVRIDMEDSPCTSKEIEIFRRLKAEFPTNVGLVLQAYMKRTLDDIKALNDINTPEAPVNLRLCKGIYIEPAEIAYKGYQNVVDHYLEDLETIFQQGMYVGIATHDKNVIEGAYKLIDKYQLNKDQYEFQMLYGVTPQLRQSILDKGHRLKVYVPFGKDWFGYSTRRLKENPKMTTHIIKAIFSKG